MVMSNECWVTPCGSISCTNCAGTVAMPTCTLPTGLPLWSSALPGAMVSDRLPTCSLVRLGDATCVVVTVVGCDALIVVRLLDWTRGR
jgi:hypothetical protein